MVIVECKVPVQLMFDDRVPDNDNDKVFLFPFVYVRITRILVFLN